MDTKKRLFDCLEYQLKHFPQPEMLVEKIKGKWVPHSTGEAQKKVNALSAGLLKLGISGNDFTAETADKIAIISSNRPEWIITDMGVQQTGAILVPIYPTTNPIELQFILQDAAVKLIFVSNADLLEKVKSVQEKVPSIVNIYTFDEIAGADHWSKITQLADEEFLAKVDAIKSTIPASHLATIIYTSGTTGTPKGVMLSHSNIYNNVLFSKQSFPFPDAPNTKVLSFLPLNHIFEK